MKTIAAAQARSMLNQLIDDVQESREPIRITGKRNKSILISKEDWRAIQATLYLSSIHGMRESIRAGLNTPVEKMFRKTRLVMFKIAYNSRN